MAASLHPTRKSGFVKNEAGNIAIIFGITFPAILGLAGFAIDGVSVNHQSSRMQNAADAAALGIAKELHLYRGKVSGKDSPEPTQLIEAGKAITEAHLETVGLTERPHSVDVIVDTKGSTIEVTISMEARTFIPGNYWAESPIRVDSVAHAYGTAKLCVLGLNGTKEKTIKVEKEAILTAPECAVQSNSLDPEGLEVSGHSTIESAGTCSSGGIKGADAINPTPETDCPPIEDPLLERITPKVTGCDYLDFEVEKGATTLSPGTYCGGIKLTKDAVVDLNPGLYIITGGKLDTGSETELRGEGVSFYFADDAATFDFKDKGLVELSAPEDGPMAGILFFGDRESLVGKRYKISSDSARKLLGTIYLPNSILEIAGTGKVGEASAYTVIVVDQLKIEEANLVVNANYAATDVPVPDGLGPNSTHITLER
jgi:putative Flp pilus-assembly TadE/G-like protein